MGWGLGGGDVGEVGALWVAGHGGFFVGFVYAEEGFGDGLSAPRRQPLNPCRPEWWCLS